jgi:hypothetical protein
MNSTIIENFPTIIELKNPDKAFDAIEYASRAVSKDKTRYVLMNICIHNGKAIATDGRRLNIARLPDAFPHSEEKVLYSVMKKTKSAITLVRNDEGGTYPNYEAVIPELDGKLGTFDCNFYKQHDGERVVSAVFCAVLQASEFKTAFHYNYFRGSMPLKSFEAYQKNEVSPLVMVSRGEDGLIDRQGIVMPIRVK